MKDEIKKILDNFKCYEERYKKYNETQFIIIERDIHLLLDYITNLQQKIEKALEIIESYELGKYDYSIPPIGIIELKGALKGSDKK